MGGFPKIRGNLLGVPIIRTTVFWGLYWGSPYFGRLPYYPRDPSIQIIPTLGPKVCKYYLHWAIWIPRVNIRIMENTRETTMIFL